MATVNAEVRFAPQLTAWFTANPTKVLQDGEIVYCSDGANIGKYVIGDNSTQLSALTFYGGISSSGLTIGTTTITSGTNTRILYNNNGVVGEYTVTGTGTTAVLGDSPQFTTRVNIGNAVTTNQRVLRVGQDTASVDIGSLFGSTSYGALYFNPTVEAPAVNNYALAGTNGETFLGVKAAGTVYIRIGNSSRISVANSQTTFTPSAASSGILIAHSFTNPANTGLTASTNIPYFKVIGNTQTWATGSLATQYFNYFSANTVAFVGASTATDVFNMYIDDCVQGTNATITNKYSLGLAGALQVPTIVGGSDVGSTIQYKGTSGNGTLTAKAHEWLTGNNGATSALSIYNNGNTSIGNYALPNAQRLVTIGQDTAFMSLGSLVGATGLWAIYGNIVTPSGTNYSYGGSASTTLMNGVNDIRFQVGGANQVTIDVNVITVTTGKNFVHGTAALATTATNGFHYVPTCAGIPTGVPTAYTGNAAMVYDSTNNKLYVYGGGAWNIMN